MLVQAGVSSYSLSKPDRVRHRPYHLAAFRPPPIPAQLRADVAPPRHVQREVERGFAPVEWGEVEGPAVGDQPEAAVNPAVDVDAEADGATVVRRDRIAPQCLETAVAVWRRAPRHERDVW